MTIRHKIVTIFGGSGFIGRHVVKRLAAEGYTVKVATRIPEAANFLKTNGAVLIQPALRRFLSIGNLCHMVGLVG